MKYLLSPYYPYLNEKRWARTQVGGDGRWFSVDYNDRDNRWYWVCSPIRMSTSLYETKEKAMKALDTTLIRDGWIFLTEEQMLLI